MIYLVEIRYKVTNDYERYGYNDMMRRGLGLGLRSSSYWLTSSLSRSPGVFSVPGLRLVSGLSPFSFLQSLT